MDVPMGEVIAVKVRVYMATVMPQVSIAAVMGMAAPGGRREVGQAAERPGP